jgi:acetoin:2,6-dichlorophenolindophenol oxidoreductase subunit beta
MTSVLDSLNIGLQQALAADERVILLGEDILDPYGGAFKITRGLSTAFPGRVLTTPISEAGIVGIAAGMALRGLRPVVEVMFGDFVTLTADQVINHAAKFRWMYNDRVCVPMVIRAPMGGRRGYGPTHSQSLEKIFLGVPGLRVLAPTHFGDPARLLAQTILKTEDPVLFVENKLLYLLTLQQGGALADFDLTQAGNSPPYAPTYRLRVRGAPDPDLTLTAYGHMADLAQQAARRLAYEQEIFIELIVPTQLAPFTIEPILESVRRTRRLLTAEEGTLTSGWGAEVLARIGESKHANLLAAERIAGRDLPIPASGPLEESVLPGVEDIVQAGIRLVREI